MKPLMVRFIPNKMLEMRLNCGVLLVALIEANMGCFHCSLKHVYYVGLRDRNIGL